MLQFLKLGGSLITDKDHPHTLRADILARISLEIARYLTENPNDQLVIGHGSGSFGHIPANEYGTKLGVKSQQEWLGFHKVWQEARALNLAVMQSLLDAGIPVVNFPASGSVTPSSAEIVAWNIEPIRSALGHGLTPVIYGDVAFDQALGGTILSTEDLFHHLALRLHPARILLAGLEEGVWQDYPVCAILVKEITPEILSKPGRRHPRLAIHRCDRWDADEGRNDDRADQAKPQNAMPDLLGAAPIIHLQRAHG